MSRPIRVVAVVGSGAMGRGIAEACLRGGLTVVLHDPDPTALKTAATSITTNIEKSVAKRLLDGHDGTQILARLSAAAEMAAISGADLVIEAVPERLALKLDVLQSIEAIVDAQAIITSNTSSIPITKLSTSLKQPSRFLGLHFFNPAPRMALVEVISTVATDHETRTAVEDFVRDQIGKTPLMITDRPGFVVNALLVPFLLSAARMLDTGYASAEAIDEGMRLGCGHPMGPLKLSDLVGLDVVCAVADAVHAETKDPAMIVPNNLRRLIDAGRLGQKTGQGFYAYD
jgi:3-hydroxybutyryl-CoA dehydrogenase